MSYLLTVVVCYCGNPIGHVADFIRMKIKKIQDAAEKNEDGSLIIDEKKIREVFERAHIMDACCKAKIIGTG